MIKQLHFDNPLLKECPLDDKGCTTVPPVWIDLLNPTPDELRQVDEQFGVKLPTLDEMNEIEISSRLYEQDDSYYMTIIYVANALGDAPETTPLTFVLKDELLITIRYKEMRIFTHFMVKAESRGITGIKNNSALMVILLETIVDTCADALEKNHAEIEAESQKIFDDSKNKQDSRKILSQIARIDGLNSKMRESLVSINRLHTYLVRVFGSLSVADETNAKLHTLTADVHSLLDHAAFISGKNSFLLDATLGRVTIEQNAIIKIFSVAAVIFLPPTLVASIYGMNFKYMPELNWMGGYPFAIGLMIVSALLPWLYFKHRGWL